MPKIKINDVVINYSKFGNGPHTLLLSYGVLGHSDNFTPIIENLDQKKYTMITWDPPGYGFSRPPDRDFSPGYLHSDADYAVSLMEALQIHRYSMLGWCNGGPVSLIAASKAVGRVQKLVVWCSNVYYTEEDIKNCDSTRNTDNWSEERKRGLEKVYGSKYFHNTWNAWVDSVRSTFDQNGGDICKDILPKINVPTLVIHGFRDILVPVKHAYYLHENIKHSTLKIFPGGTHGLHFMMTEQFIAVLDHFLTTDTEQ